MALSAVLPDAALRVTRTAAGRRALQVALLVGGLFVLGLLCGEQARAADGVAPASKPTDVVRSVTSSVEEVANSGSARVSSSTTPPSAATAPSDSGSATASNSNSATASGSGSGSEQPRLRLPKAITPVTDEVQRVVRPVTEPVVRPVAEQVVRPVTERVIPPVAEDVVRPIGDLVDQIAGGVTGGIVERPAPPQWWPSLPQLPTLPGLPGLPELPGLPLPAVPGQTLPVGTAPQQPGGAKDDHRAAEKQSRDESAATVYGPRFAVGLTAAGDGVRHHADIRGTGAVQAPVHQVPDGDPTGALGRHSAVDNGSPRHGDGQAVALNERARPTLVPGAAVDVTAAGTRDRHRDIPAFPG
ncbi:hypothetical protein FHS35_002510 [Streptomyces umbrinus]|uniref:hypothetical protein n=1 Tax=Streptomyces umbrinus TaxID=67370 RepID=UPI00167D04A0|nr:hypothetical protein [Streptomyces umbrinus]MCR3725662.1 hypothetical protein [Streptomyces umbrinus]GHH48744.1 hypothetical protein GCM10018775_43330 [Streptomyces umbrinus]